MTVILLNRNVEASNPNSYVTLSPSLLFETSFSFSTCKQSHVWEAGSSDSGPSNADHTEYQQVREDELCWNRKWYSIGMAKQGVQYQDLNTSTFTRCVREIVELLKTPFSHKHWHKRKYPIRQSVGTKFLVPRGKVSAGWHRPQLAVQSAYVSLLLLDLLIIHCARPRVVILQQVWRRSKTSGANLSLKERQDISSWSSLWDIFS